MVDGATFQADDTCESVVVVDGSGSGNLGTEPMASDSGHGDLLLVHEPDDISRHVIEGEGVVMVGVSEVSVVQEPDVPVVSDLVVFTGEELGKVLCRLEQVREPNHGRQVFLLALDKLPSQLHLVRVLLVCGLRADGSGSGSSDGVPESQKSESSLSC